MIQNQITKYFEVGELDLRRISNSKIYYEFGFPSFYIGLSFNINLKKNVLLKFENNKISSKHLNHIQLLFDFKCNCKNSLLMNKYKINQYFCFQCFYEQKSTKLFKHLKFSCIDNDVQKLLNIEYMKNLNMLIEKPFILIIVCHSDRFSLITALNLFDIPGFPKSKTKKVKGRSSKKISKSVINMGLSEMNLVMIHNQFFDSYKCIPKLHGISLNLKTTGKFSTAQANMFNKEIGNCANEILNLLSYNFQKLFILYIHKNKQFEKTNNIKKKVTTKEVIEMMKQEKKLAKKIRKKIKIKKTYIEKYLNSTGNLTNSRILKRNKLIKDSYKLKIFSSRKAIAKLWKIPNHPFIEILINIKKNGFKKIKEYNEYSYEKIILILKDQVDKEACLYFIGKSNLEWIMKIYSLKFETQLILNLFNTLVRNTQIKYDEKSIPFIQRRIVYRKMKKFTLHLIKYFMYSNKKTDYCIQISRILIKKYGWNLEEKEMLIWFVILSKLIPEEFTYKLHPTGHIFRREKKIKGFKLFELLHQRVEEAIQKLRLRWLSLTGLLKKN